MKRGTPRHWKTAQLAKELGVSIYSAVGILEILWHVASEFTPRGDLGRMPDDAIAGAVGWEKDPETLVAALVKCRWLDAHDVHRLVVHDWSQHVEDSVHMRLAREGMLFADNKAPRTSRLGKEERKECERKLSHALAVHTKSALPSHPIPSHPIPSHPKPNLSTPSKAAATQLVNGSKGNGHKDAAMPPPDGEEIPYVVRFRNIRPEFKDQRIQDRRIADALRSCPKEHLERGFADFERDAADQATCPAKPLKMLRAYMETAALGPKAPRNPGKNDRRTREYVEAETELKRL